MKNYSLEVGNRRIDVLQVECAVVGSGAAGFAAASDLHDNGVTDIALLTENINSGTSRNAGSDKQTYYKMSCSGDSCDSVARMARDLFACGGKDGDVALCEAALSLRCFFHLCNLGVPFPHNRFGEYVGYRTDHDSMERASSCGPLTSRYMTEALEREAVGKGIPIFDGWQVISLLVRDGGICGLLCISRGSNGHLVPAAVQTSHVIYATGGPAGMYEASVYPESQNGATGIALEAGAFGANLCESQYGIASTGFRWNLSGSYQQVLPRYYSTDKNGEDEQEFLNAYFPSGRALANAQFLKGYQWPFDVRRIRNGGSSLLDILVYYESVFRDRLVFMDFRRNPSPIDRNGSIAIDMLPGDAADYLTKSAALLTTPIDRLCRMNAPAVQLFADHGIDLTKQPLPIAVCAQHNNGGLYADAWWQSNICGLFPVGEACGNFGPYRPGGSALNATQVGALRAAQFIAHHPRPKVDDRLYLETLSRQCERLLPLIEVESTANTKTIDEVLARHRKAMTACGAHIRDIKQIEAAWKNVHEDRLSLDRGELVSDAMKRPEAFFHLRDTLLAQEAYLSSMQMDIRSGNQSRGSCLISNINGECAAPGLPDRFCFSVDETATDRITTFLFDGKTGTVSTTYRLVRPIPKDENWFENIWNDYRSGDVFL